MPRRYYRRRTVVVRPKKKWASNIVIRNFNITTGNPVPYTTLVSNSLQSGTPTPVIVKAGNFKVNADIFVSASSTQDDNLQVMALVLYLPEGVTITNNSDLGAIVAAHPEYIMAWKQFDLGNISGSANSQQVAFSSRLKRNLNSGDQVVFGILYNITSGTISRVRAAITVQYWTCAN